MHVCRANGGASLTQEEVDYAIFRSCLWVMLLRMRAHDMFEDGADDDIRFAEMGAWLIPGFVNCVANVLDQILQRELAALP